MSEKITNVNHFKRSVECPNCLFGSGIVADGRGTTCGVCAGRGTVSRRTLIDFNKEMGL